MPIVFIHGVAVRDRSAFPGIEAMLREYIAPKLARDPENVDIFYAFWGDRAATFAWDRASLPVPAAAPQGGQLLSMGERASALVASGITAPPRRPATTTAGTGAIAQMGATGAALAPPPTIPPVMAVDDVVDLLCSALAQQLSGADSSAKVASAARDADYARAAIAIDRAVRDIAAGAPVLTLDTPMLNEIRRRAQLAVAGVPIARGAVATQGSNWIATAISVARTKAGEAIQSAEDVWGDAMARALLGIRKPLNGFLTMFTGDVFAYIRGRDEQLGIGSAIKGIVLDALKRALASQQRRGGERIVILSHSMGGQLTYDALTHYVPADPELAGLKVDLWAAAASQVGLFEELKLFKTSDDAYSAQNGKVPALPAERCAHWWNVWDPNDFASYTAAPIFEGVDDEEFKSDRTPLDAHGAYLVLPRFYRRMAEKL